MFPPTTDHEINYRINAQINRVRLTLWETAPKQSQSVSPYLYIVNYLLKSVEDAHQVLRDHLFVNGVATVDDLEFPFQGSIRVLPYSTWSSFEVYVEDRTIVSQAS
jgi:hypothetical protein